MSANDYIKHTISKRREILLDLRYKT